MLNIVIPMAGRGSRFQKEGYTTPKPLIPVHDKTMIEVIINNLKPAIPHKFIFVCLEEHMGQYGLKNKLQKWAPGCEIVTTDGVTEGAACTVLLAEKLIDNDNPLMIANSDQWVDLDINKYLDKLDNDGLDGLIMTMWANDNKWSFVGFDDKQKITKVVEKEVVSNEATVGIYNFSNGHKFCSSARSMIEKNLRVNNEFYVAPVYNELIYFGANLDVYNIGKLNDGMYGLGIPCDLNAFLKMEVSRKAVNFK